jgi:hypothetical protein
LEEEGEALDVTRKLALLERMKLMRRGQEGLGRHKNSKMQEAEEEEA